MLCDRHGLLGFLLLFTMNSPCMFFWLAMAAMKRHLLAALYSASRTVTPAGQIPNCHYCADVMRSYHSYYLSDVLSVEPQSPDSTLSGRLEEGSAVVSSAEDHTILHTSSARTQRERPIDRFQRRFQRKSSILLHALALLAGPLRTGRSFCRT